MRTGGAGSPPTSVASALGTLILAPGPSYTIDGISQSVVVEVAGYTVTVTDTGALEKTSRFYRLRSDPP